MRAKDASRYAQDQAKMTSSPTSRHLFGSKHSEIEAQLKEANNLVNPNSGIANDYLNQYNEILLLVENLPILIPEMIDELLSWRPKSYREYFETSPLPGGDLAIKIYGCLNQDFRERFEAHINKINTFAIGAVAVIAKQRHQSNEICPEYIERFCYRVSTTLKIEIEKANDFVNHGLDTPPETPQEMADRLMQVAETL
jgi:hypothetical protein